MNAPLGKIYLMTADHCFTDKTEVSDFEFWMLLFNYYTQCGNDTSPPVTQLIQVSTLCRTLHMITLSCTMRRVLLQGYEITYARGRATS